MPNLKLARKHLNNSTLDLKFQGYVAHFSNIVDYSAILILC